MDNEKHLAEEQIKNKGEYISLTAGVSMRPLLRQGKDIVRVTAVTKPLKKYDVGLYRSKKDILILHRIIGSDGDYYLFRGDNLISTERIQKDRVFGVLSGFYRNKKHYIDCENPSWFYKAYIVVNQFSFPLRRFFRLNFKRIKKAIKRYIKR